MSGRPDRPPPGYQLLIFFTFLSLYSYSAAVQGWLLTPNNLDTFMRSVVSGLHKLEEHVSRVAAFVIDELGSGELLTLSLNLNHADLVPSQRHCGCSRSG